MMQNSQDCTAVVDDGETAQRADLAGNVVKGYSRDSINGSPTLVSNLSSYEDDSTHSKSNTIRCRLWIILLSIIFALSVLCLGYWIGWVIGEREESSNSTVIEINDTLSPIADLPVLLNPTPMPSLTPEVSPVAVPTPPPLSDSPAGSNVGSTTMPVNNVEPPTEPPVELSKSPVTAPFTSPTDAPSVSTGRPVRNPTPMPSLTPEASPVAMPTPPPLSDSPVGTDPVDKVTYIPGNLTRLQNKLLLSEGLEARIIAETGKRVKFDDGSSSNIKFHTRPDAGATFPDTRSWNDGGWIYTSNSEGKMATEGGVGAITFDRHGSVVKYDMVLKNTQMNCGGGRTPWNTWVSCEEVEFTGQIYQVDPTGERDPERMTLGSAGGRWESFAYDVRDKSKPRFFNTEDHNKGTTRRFTPTTTHWGGNEWKMLHEEGVIDYLFVNLNDKRTGGTFEWTDNLNAARNNARSFFPQSEGIDIQEGIMYIVCKKIQQLFVFDLDQMTYHNVSTVSGLFDGDPDQMQRIVGKKGGLLYFTEEGGENAGVHARDELGRFFTILESPFFNDETTGLSFSPDAKHMYIAYQETGILYDVTREDGLAFDAKSLDVKYHRSISSRRLNSQWIGM